MMRHTFELIAKRNHTFSVFIFMLILVFSLDYILATRVFPITEGWWETYSWFIHNGLVPYKDFSLKFPPLFVYLNLLLTNSIGYDFYQIRLLGVALHLIEVISLYYLLRKFSTSSIPAIFGTTIAVGLVMSNPVYIAKDYHTLQMILVLWAMFFISNHHKFNDESSHTLSISIIISGILCGLLLLLKQNVGVFFSMGVFLYILSLDVYYKIRLKQILTNSTLFLISFLVPAFTLTYYIGYDWLQIFVGNNSKGGIFQVLFRFLIDQSCLHVEMAALFLFSACYLVHRFLPETIVEKSKSLFGNLNGWKLYFILISPLFFVSGLVLSAALAWPFLRFKYGSFHNKFLILPLVSLAYCGTLTAGYNFVSMELLIAIMFTELASFLSHKNPQDTKFIPLCFLIATSFFVAVYPKITLPPYNWWGLQAGCVTCNTVKLPFASLRNLSTDDKTAKMFEAVKVVANEIQKQDRIFAYPSIPIVYQLLNKLPIGTPVLWFDVASTKDGKTTADELSKVHPRYIFWLKPPAYVYQGHFKLRKSDPAMLYVDRWIYENIQNGNYKIIKVIVSDDIKAKFYTDFSDQNLLEIKRRLNDQFLNDDLLMTLDDGSFTYGNTNLDSVKLNFSSKLALNDFIEKYNVFADSNGFVFYILASTSLIDN